MSWSAITTLIKQLLKSPAFVELVLALLAALLTRIHVRRDELKKESPKRKDAVILLPDGRTKGLPDCGSPASSERKESSRRTKGKLSKTSVRGSSSKSEERP